MATTDFGVFVAGIPGPLGIGEVELEDGETVRGFLCEAYAVESAPDITRYGGWVAYAAALETPPQTATRNPHIRREKWIAESS